MKNNETTNKDKYEFKIDEQNNIGFVSKWNNKRVTWDDINKQKWLVNLYLKRKFMIME